MKKSDLYLNEAMSQLQNSKLSSAVSVDRAKRSLNRALAALEDEEEMEDVVENEVGAEGDADIIDAEDLRDDIVAILKETEPEKVKKVFVKFIKNMGKKLAHLPAAQSLFDDINIIIEESDEDKEAKYNSRLAQALVALKNNDSKGARRIVAELLEEEEVEEEFKSSRSTGCEECDKDKEMMSRRSSAETDYSKTYEKVFQMVGDDKMYRKLLDNPQTPDFAFDLIAQYSNNPEIVKEAEQRAGGTPLEEAAARNRSRNRASASATFRSNRARRRVKAENDYMDLWDEFVINSKDLSVRLKAAELEETPPAVLDRLHNDPDPGVVEAVENNPSFKGPKKAADKDDTMVEEEVAARYVKKAHAALKRGKKNLATAYLKAAEKHAR